MVEIEIRDHGEGVDPADLPRLIRPFEQGGATLTRASEGAGLGLPIVDLLTRAMDGGLRLKSTPGQGFTAIVTLPEVHAGPRARPSVSRDASRLGETAFRFRRRALSPASCNAPSTPPSTNWPTSSNCSATGRSAIAT
jgi:hypothetical protein